MSRLAPGYLAFVAHRLSGIGLAVFLPLHFIILGLALEGEAALDGALRWSESPAVKFAEWGLVILLVLHLMLGLRVLALEWLVWRGPRMGLIVTAVVFALLAGAGFIAGVL